MLNRNRNISLMLYISSVYACTYSKTIEITTQCSGIQIPLSGRLCKIKIFNALTNIKHWKRIQKIICNTGVKTHAKLTNLCHFR